MLSYWKKQIPLLKQIAKEEGTPLYVYQPDIISVKLNELKQAFKNLSFDIHYAMKANENTLYRFWGYGFSSDYG